jgi:alkane 1-monooxygenase
VELLSGSSSGNEHSAADDPFPEFILFAHIITHSICLWSFFRGIQAETLKGMSLLGAILSTGAAAGSSGIIVAHELIHKASRMKRFLGKYLLASTGNFYFYVHHLRVHHRYVATSQDAATARFGEPLYAFFLRSVQEQIAQSAASEHKRLGGRWFSWSNELTKAIVWIMVLAVLVFMFAGFQGLLSWFGVCLFANFLLEYVNYIEHYGLTRRPETKVNEWHSWSCNKHISRFLLIDLSRHADHHSKASKPYHTLDSYSQGPMLPGGYASLILPALLPFWWYRLTHPILEKIHQDQEITH